MTRTSTILAVTGLMVLPITAVQARPARAPAKSQIARVETSAAVKTRQNALNDFTARMSRLDALMGVPATRPVRARSAEAGR
jgi:hypothetical protein